METAPPTDAEDVSLVERASRGDRQAMNALVHRHRGAVFQFARRILADAALAEDVLQETFIAAHASLASFRGAGTVKGWLLAIARAKAATALRRRAGEPATFDPVDSLEVLGARAGWGHPLSPEDLASRVEQRSLLERALAALATDEREVVVLRDVEGLSGDETAAAVGISIAAMKSRLHRGRLQLLAQVKSAVQP